MHVGIGMPVADPAQLVTWARRADAGPFRTIALLDRLAYDNPEPLFTLATLAAVTERVRLQTEVLIAPLHRTALLAKQAATLDVLSNGRFTLGMGIGGWERDYEVAGVEQRARGARLDAQVHELRALWAGDVVGPRPLTPGGPEVLFGGFVPAVFERVARSGDGFLGAALPPAPMGTAFAAVVEAWKQQGRDGAPRLVAQVNAVIGPDAVADRARAELRLYYGDVPYLDHILGSLPTTAVQVRGAIDAYASVGADEVVLYLWADDPDQVDRLADVIG